MEFHSREPDSQPPQIHRRSGKLLVVDDDPDLSRLLTTILGANHEVVAAADGESALQLCSEHHPDLILLDLDLPDMDGLSVCRKLRLDPSSMRTPVIFITAYQGTEEETACWEAGGSDFVCKPINPLTLAHRVDAHLGLKFQADSLQELAYMDGLTGIANRRYFRDRISAECGIARRHGHALTLLLIDLDCFKQYNDGYGHVAGDHCLARVAHGLHACLKRPSDFVARYGGEEFACLLPATRTDQAMKVAERMQAAIAALAIEHQYSPHRQQLTLSIGLAQYAAAQMESPDQLIARADRALYQAKRAGRDQLAVAAET